MQQTIHHWNQECSHLCKHPALPLATDVDKDKNNFMEEVKLELNEKGRGAFFVMDGEERLGEMVISVHGKSLTVFHTEVSPKAEGKGLAKKMLHAMTDYARKNSLKVTPLCSFVHAQFKRHPADYADIWDRDKDAKNE